MRGTFPHPGEVDDGHAHKTFTDWRLGLHYQVSEGPVAFAPYIQYLAPITDYETMGHSAPGRGLEEFWVGFFAGRNLDRLLPRSYVQLRYNYSSSSRSRASATIAATWTLNLAIE